MVVLAFIIGIMWFLVTMLCLSLIAEEVNFKNFLFWFVFWPVVACMATHDILSYLYYRDI
jgi:hypothetical protein